MISKFAFIAALAVLTRAFSIPPEISSSDTTLIDTLPIEAAIQAKSQILSLECAGCPAPSIDALGNRVWALDIVSQLKLFFSIERSNDGDFLSLNNLQIFPSVPVMEPLTVVQVAKGDVAWHVRIGYELSVLESVRERVSFAEDRIDDLVVISITLQVVEVGNWLVNGLQAVEIELLQAPDGSLLIMRTSTADTKNPLINPADKGEKCNTIICMFRAAMTRKISNLKKMKGCGSKSKKLPGGMGKHNGARPHGGPTRFQQKQHGFARIFYFLKRMAFHIMLPVFVGIFVGVGACLIGSIVGNMIVFLWRALYRRGQKGTYSKVQQEQTDGKISVVMDLPPAYKDNLVEKAAN